jgi:hypothetical protein
VVDFNTIILQFASQGEKTGWTYIEIPADMASELKPGNKQSFRVKGMLDNHPVNGIALMPMGEGNFIMPLNADMRRGIRKSKGAMLHLCLEVDLDFKIEPPADLLECLEDEPGAIDFFNSLAKSHRDYFVKWIESAKTFETRSKRIAQTVTAMSRGWDYGQMMREFRKIKNNLAL